MKHRRDPVEHRRDRVEHRRPVSALSRLLALTGLLPFLPFLALSGISCRSVERAAEFRVVAMDTEERAIPCIVVLDNDVVLDGATNRPVRTPVTLQVSFREAKDQSGDLERVELGVRAVTTDSEGNIVGGLESTSPAPYIEQKRFLRPQDARTQIFFLRRNREFEG